MPPTPTIPREATILFDSLPPKAFLGFNLIAFNSSPIFRGIQQIPAGIHFLYSGTDASLSIRQGYWLDLDAVNVHVFRWDAQEERLLPTPSLDAAFQHAIASQPDLRSRGLVDFPALVDALVSKQESQHESSSDDWPTLASRITVETLTRILGPRYCISSISSAPQDSETIPGLEHSEVIQNLTAHDEMPLNFIPVDLRRTWPAAAVGRERTDAARDRSWYLGHLMDELVPGDRTKAAGELLGEMQFCFSMVLTLANYSCLEQWKRLLGLLLTCRTAVKEVEAFFVEALKILQSQLRHCEDVEGGLFEFRDEGTGNWLRALLRVFKGVVGDTCGGHGKLADELSEIEDLMRERYGWEVESAMLRRGVVELEDGERAELTLDGADEEDEMGEYAPVYVETLK